MGYERMCHERVCYERVCDGLYYPTFDSGGTRAFFRRRQRLRKQFIHA